MTALTRRSPDEDVDRWLTETCAGLAADAVRLDLDPVTHGRLYGYAIDRRSGLVDGPVRLDFEGRLWLDDGTRAVELPEPASDADGFTAAAVDFALLMLARARTRGRA